MNLFGKNNVMGRTFTWKGVKDEVTFGTAEGLEAYNDMCRDAIDTLKKLDATQQDLSLAAKEILRIQSVSNHRQQQITALEQKIREGAEREGKLLQRLKEPNGELRDLTIQRFKLVSQSDWQKVSDENASLKERLIDMAGQLLSVENWSLFAVSAVNLLDRITRKNAKCPDCGSRGRCLQTCELNALVATRVRSQQKDDGNESILANQTSG